MSVPLKEQDSARSCYYRIEGQPGLSEEKKNKKLSQQQPSSSRTNNKALISASPCPSICLPYKRQISSHRRLRRRRHHFSHSGKAPLPPPSALSFATPPPLPSSFLERSALLSLLLCGAASVIDAAVVQLQLALLALQEPIRPCFGSCCMYVSVCVCAL